MNKRNNSWLALTFGLLFGIMIGLAILSLSYNPYNKGYQIGINDTFNNYNCYKKINQTDFKNESLNESSLFIVSKYKGYDSFTTGNFTLPEYYGFFCSEKYKTKVNETYIGCVLR